MDTLPKKSFENTEFILVQHDLGAPGRGAGEGPRVLLNDLFKTDSKLETTSIQILQPPQEKEDAEKTPHAKSMERTLATMKIVRDCVSETLKRGRFPVVLSGDHSTATGTIAGIKTAFPSQELGVVWFDAHTDIHSPFTTHTSNMHGMPLAAAIANDNLAYQRQPITVFEHKLWNDIKSLTTSTPMVELENIVFIGIRDMEQEESDLVKSRDCLILDADYVQNQTAVELVQKTKNHLRHCDVVYVSFDIDCLDKSLVPGTGTPVDGGPDAAKVLEIVAMLSTWDRAISFELSEVNPSLDPSGRTLQVAAQVARNALSGFAK